MKSLMRHYFADDWHCNCDNHTIEGDIQILKNIFKEPFDEAKVTYSKDYENYSVFVRTSCVLDAVIYQAEFHGLFLSSIHCNSFDKFSNGLTFLFKRIFPKGDLTK